MIRVKCDCGATFNAKDDRAGKVFKCSECGNTLRISKPELDSSTVPPAGQPHAKSMNSRPFPKLVWVAVAAAVVLTLLLTSKALQEARDNNRRYWQEISEDADSAVAFQQRQAIRRIDQNQRRFEAMNIDLTESDRAPERIEAQAEREKQIREEQSKLEGRPLAERQEIRSRIEGQGARLDRVADADAQIERLQKQLAIEPKLPGPDAQAVLRNDTPQTAPEALNRKQAVVTFPTKRRFNHGMLIETKKVDDNGEIRQLTMKTDEGLGMVMAHFSLEKDAAGDLTVHNRGSFGFFSYEKNWSKLYPEKLAIVIDGEAVFQKCKRSDELIIAEFHLLDYERLLKAKAITFEVGTVKFNLTSRHIEAMKELASGLPDGDTKGGWCVIRHEPDTVGKIDDPLLITVDRDEALQVEQMPNEIGSLSSEQNLKAESIKQGDKNAASMPSAAMLKRSKTNLDSAKKLLKSRKDVAAKKLLEKAVNDAPKSESGKEAAKILKSLR